MERLAKDNPSGFLEKCLICYKQKVKGYTCTFQKQERIEGKLQDKEIIEVACREKPFSVYFCWIEGPAWQNGSLRRR